jgi:iron complex outermembrane receptor protein
MRRIQLYLGASAVTLALGMGTSALAADQKASTLDEVVVTARRVEENIQTVPISITAITSETIADKSVLNLSDLERLTPGLFYSPFGANQTAPTLRGVGTYAAGDAVRPVVTYFAEVPIWPTEGTPPVFDLANIQVLKGPQGTLFGRNAYAGAVLLTPVAPQPDFGGYLKLAAGNYAYKSVEGAINLPIVEDKLAVRLSGLYQRRDGYTKNISGPDADDLKENNLRLSVLFTPIDNLKITEILDYRDSPAHGQGNINLNVDPSVAGLLAFVAPTLYNCASRAPSCNVAVAVQQAHQLAPNSASYSVRPSSKVQSWGSTTKADYALGDVDIVNIFGVRHHTGSNYTPVDGLPLAVPLISAFSRDHADQISEELHINGKSFDDRLSWIGGLFYSHTKSETVGALTVLPALSAPGPVQTPVVYRTNITKAVFAQVTWDFSEQIKGLTLDLGARYNWDEKSSCFRNIQGPSYLPPSQGTLNPLAGRSDCGVTLAKQTYKGESPTWMVSLNYQASDDVFLYLTSRRGYREGTLNLPDLSGTILAAYQSAGPEKDTDIEVGLKSNWRMGDVRGQFNIDAYHVWYKGTQVGVPTGALQRLCPPFVPAGNPLCLPAAQQPVGGSINVNLGKQEVSGFEAQLVIRPTDDLTLTGGVAYTHLDKTDFTVPAFATARLVSIFSPLWAANASVRYQLPIHPIDPDSRLVFNADFTYSDKILNFGTRETPSWTQTGARLDWQDIGRKGLTLSAFVTNIFDEANIIALAGGTGIDFGYYNAPRMYGLEAKLEF